VAIFPPGTVFPPGIFGAFGTPINQAMSAYAFSIDDRVVTKGRFAHGRVGKIMHAFWNGGFRAYTVAFYGPPYESSSCFPYGYNELESNDLELHDYREGELTLANGLDYVLEEVK
jgi:hypothetical protein